MHANVPELSDARELKSGLGLEVEVVASASFFLPLFAYNSVDHSAGSEQRD